MISSSSRLTAAAILAHQGGWDEALMVAGPLLLVALLLYLANRRVNDRLSQADRSTSTTPTVTDRDAIPPADSGTAHRSSVADEQNGS